MTRILRILALVLLFSSSAYADIITVTDLSDDFDATNGTCNLREAISAAATDFPRDACPAGNGEDSIVFVSGGGITLLDEINILSGTRILGPGSSRLTINANNAGRIFKLQAPNSDLVLISGMTLSSGLANGSGDDGRGGAIFVNVGSKVELVDLIVTDSQAEEGGGIYQKYGSSLSIKRSVISRNIAGVGGGIAADNFSGTIELLIEDSSILKNTATADATFLSGGGGLYLTFSSPNTAQAEIIRSTISGNEVNNDGGGILINLEPNNNSRLAIIHSTITNNVAGLNQNNTGDGGGFFAVNFGGGSEYYFENSIVAGNEDRSRPGTPKMPDIGFENPSLGSVTTRGFNLISDNTGAVPFFPVGNPNANMDYVGDVAAPLSADLDVIDDNGGPTPTHMPSPINDSHVIDKGSCDDEIRDQRGFAAISGGPRQEGPCDIGAVEFRTNPVSVPVDVKVFLSGPFDGVEMDISKDESFLPSMQPYNTSPWNYTGMESINIYTGDTGDWVLVGIHTLDPFGSFNLIDQIAAIVLEDGTIVRSTYSGSSYDRLDFPGLEAGPYYISVDHRNHLSIISKAPVTLEWDGATLLDFTQDSDQAYTAGGIPLQALPNGNFGMWGGDGDKNDAVTAFDFLNTWLPFNGGPLGYDQGDFNLDGVITAFDFLLVWLPANGQSSQVP